MKRIAVVTVLLTAMLAGCAASDESAGAGDAAEEAVPQAADGGVGGGGEQQAAADAAPGSSDDRASAVLTAEVGDRIVRDGTMRIRVDEDAFDGAFDRLVQTADRFGGTVLSSDASTADDGSTSGTVTVRVPAADFDDLLVAAGRIGEVEQRSITSQDVSDEYVDLEARLRHNQAQERFYLSLLDRAEDVDDAIAVQQQVAGIQQTIEQIEGRLRFLDERTSYSRLTVELFEAGGAFQTGSAPQPSLARYWVTARAALVNVLGGALVVGSVALPFVVVGAVILVLARRHGVQRRRAVAPDA
jgi:hypothetical protein